MDTLFHFIFALMGGLAIGFFRSREYSINLIIAASIVSILIDVDHFLVPLKLASSYTLLHNIYIVFFLPLSLFLLARYYRYNTKFQAFLLLLMIMLTGHVIADMFCGPISFFCPLDNTEFMIPELEIMLTSSFSSPVLGKGGIAITMYALVILFAISIDRITCYQILDIYTPERR